MRIQLISEAVEPRWKNYRRFLKPIFNSTFLTINYQSEKTDATVVLIRDAEMRRMNKEFRNIDKTTDVLTFMDDEEASYLGDVFVNVDALERQATDYGHSLKREFCFLVTHGALHLLGYDHQNEQESKEMFSLQEEILREIAPRITKEV
ncbi:MAG: rRNA maturation RNase YbeY [Erysipelothrix sp.]|nr:rRNA maturation RNase YbeY [Erysipelothrix sp.]